MKYEDWLAAVPVELREDALWQMKVYPMAVFAGDLAWADVGKLWANKRLWGLSDQLYRAIGSVGANIAEGYSRQSGKEQAHFYEYALGSAREARHWYHQARHTLRPEVVAHRMGLLTEIIRLLLTIIPKERSRAAREPATNYNALPCHLLDDPPMP
ncbi:MAG TPA: four helix bundle protein [Anaerolineae bacterium]|nr:four helix bundle protein [Anaerolineae bacterium]